MGNCCGTQSSRPQAYTLSERPPGGRGGNWGDRVFGTSGGASGGAGGKAESPADRNARLAAAEQRKAQAEARGVQIGGGKLSKQLADQRGRKLAPEEAPAVDNLMWRAD
ncbi:hypothetical protein BC936DRAFT_138058 [Jimgerdemannia flammicorona]|uniref:Uncharacterized protein n=1 Tax=Jimgerdemannia flammicorona TaxID=994334 RepID=A0A433CW91_9FUNG|nr:hypothetical protein BC936DRAFT_138058 [Jimgerdemannia flammicorona]